MEKKKENNSNKLYLPVLVIIALGIGVIAYTSVINTIHINNIEKKITTLANVDFSTKLNSIDMKVTNLQKDDDPFDTYKTNLVSCTKLMISSNKTAETQTAGILYCITQYLAKGK
jgi:hypothetical protein